MTFSSHCYGTHAHLADPASADLISGDRLLAAANNKAMAFNKATKAAVREATTS
jgi:hypothetical protein